MYMVPPPDAPVTIAPGAVLEVCFCHHLRRTTRAVSRIYDRAFAPLGIKASQFNVLVAIAAASPAPFPALADALCLERTTLLRNLRPLRDQGFLQVTQGSGRRPDEVALTIAGQNLLTQAIQAWRGAQTQVTQRLGGVVAGQLLQGFGRLTGAI